MAQDSLAIPYSADLFGSIKAELTSMVTKSNPWNVYPAQTRTVTPIPNAGMTIALTGTMSPPVATADHGTPSMWATRLDEKFDNLNDKFVAECENQVDETAQQTFLASLSNAKTFAFEFFEATTPAPAVIVHSDGVAEMIWRLSGWTLEVSFVGPNIQAWARNRRSTEIWSGAIDEVRQELSELLKTFARATQSS